MKTKNFEFLDKLKPENFINVAYNREKHLTHTNVYMVIKSFTGQRLPDSLERSFVIAGNYQTASLLEYIGHDFIAWCWFEDLEVLEFMQDKFIDEIELVRGMIDPLDPGRRTYLPDRVKGCVDGYEIIIYYHELNQNPMKKQNVLNVRQVKGIFHFSEPFRHWDKEVTEELQATVVLEIDYNVKEYSITSGCGTTHFVFHRTSHKKDMWLAVLRAITNAIEFAEKELKSKTDE